MYFLYTHILNKNVFFWYSESQFINIIFFINTINIIRNKPYDIYERKPHSRRVCTIRTFYC
jgi:hypothetical protein